MTMPNKDTRNEPGVRSRGKRANPETIAILLLCLVVCIYVSFHKTNDLIDHHDNHVAHKDVHAEAPVRVVGTERLAHEDLFLETLKSCLPETQKKKCKTFIPEGSSTQRVALIAPPGDMTHMFFRLLQVVLERAKRKQPNLDIELIPTTHVAPYGYGKTHGWTKIIRVVPRPLLLGVTNTLQSSLQHGKSQRDITLSDVKANLRQQIRYHCRLSHVAAHTALWTLTLEDLANESLDGLIDQVQTFLGLEQADILQEMQEEQGDDLVPPDNMEGSVMAMYSYGASMLTFVQTTVKEDVLKVMDDVLLEELHISKNLTAWPCESFWTVGEPADRIKLAPMVSRIATAVSPNCTAPFTSCFVKRDICEAKGDGKCS